MPPSRISSPHHALILSPSTHASRDSKSSIVDAPVIPIELFYEIFENLPRSSLASVARANTSFNDLSEKVMYRRLELTSYHQATQCFRTLQKKPSTVQYVRELVVMIQYVAMVVRTSSSILTNLLEGQELFLKTSCLSSL